MVTEVFFNGDREIYETYIYKWGETIFSSCDVRGLSRSSSVPVKERQNGVLGCDASLGTLPGVTTHGTEDRVSLPLRWQPWGADHIRDRPELPELIIDVVCVQVYRRERLSAVWC